MEEKNMEEDKKMQEIPESHKYKRYKVSIEVESAVGYCTAGHEVGDKWIFDGQFTPAGMCASAYYTCYLGLRVLSLGGPIPWENPETQDEWRGACPDGKCPRIFHLKRLYD